MRPAPEPLRGKSDVLEAVKATRDRIFDPVLLGFEHLGDGLAHRCRAVATLGRGRLDGRQPQGRPRASRRREGARESRLFDGRRGSRGIRGATVGPIGVTAPCGARHGVPEPRRRPGRRPRRRDPLLRGGIRPRAHPRSVVRRAGRLASSRIAAAPPHGVSGAAAEPGALRARGRRFRGGLPLGHGCRRALTRVPTALRSSSSRAASARCTSTTRAATSSRSATGTPAAGGSRSRRWFAWRISSAERLCGSGHALPRSLTGPSRT